MTTNQLLTYFKERRAERNKQVGLPETLLCFDTERQYYDPKTMPKEDQSWLLMVDYRRSILQQIENRVSPKS